MVAARRLAGTEISLLLLGSPEELKGDAARAWNDLLKAPGEVHIHIVREAAELEQHKELLDCDLLIDAVLGTGFQPPMRGLALAAMEWLRKSSAPVLSVDLPSGWSADSTAATTSAFPSDAVVTFTAPKPAHLFGQLTRRWNQPVLAVPIGSPEAAIEASLTADRQNLYWACSALELAQRPRPAASNKGNFGHVLVVGGCMGSAGGKVGAPAMAALASLRSGAGLVTAAVPAPALAVVASFAPELMTWPLEATSEGSIAIPTEEAPLQKLTAGKSVLAIGPGLGQHPASKTFVQKLLATTRAPAVLDADALNLLSSDPAWMEMLSDQARNGRTIVLTPHPGEMARLSGLSTTEVQADRPGTASAFAQKTGFIVVLKGARTLIAHPDGSIAINTSGNPGMAKGGSGDVLTGLIAGLLAQHPQDPYHAVEAAVCLHGLSADFAVGRLHERTLMATDLLQDLSRAFSFRCVGPGRYVWLQGQPPQSFAAIHEAVE